jgi:hypothetical protein
VSADVAARAGLPDPRPQADAALRLIHAVGAPAG